MTVEQFARLAEKAGLSEKITLDTVTDTVEAFRSVWRNFDIKVLNNTTRRVIDKHLATVPLWRAPARHSTSRES
jgi:hypothetical protein